MIFRLLLFLIRLFRFYVWRTESILSLIFLWFIWAYIKGISLKLPFIRSSRLDHAINAYLTEPPTTAHAIENDGPGDGGAGGLHLKLSRKPFNIGLMKLKNIDSMEDRMSIAYDPGETDDDDLKVFGVYDGHGGKSVASYIESQFAKSMVTKIRAAEQSLKKAQKPNTRRPNIAQIMRDEVEKLDKEIVDDRNSDYVGSTLVTAVLYKSRWLIVGNVGDSRGVYCDKSGKARNLTVDHKPDHPEEKSRIERAGGFVQWIGVWRVAGILAMSRSMGDNELKRKGFITAKPDIQTYDLWETGWKFLVLASDGLWDVLSPEFTVDAFKVRIPDWKSDPLMGAQKLTERALRQGSFDNVSTMLILLPQKKPSSPDRKAANDEIHGVVSENVDESENVPQTSSLSSPADGSHEKEDINDSPLVGESLLQAN